MPLALEPQNVQYERLTLRMPADVAHGVVRLARLHRRPLTTEALIAFEEYLAAHAHELGQDEQP